MWTPEPRKVIAYTAAGSADMGDVTDELSICRFALDAAHYPQDVPSSMWRFVPVFIRGGFSGGTGSDTLTLKVDHRSTLIRLDHTLCTVASVGTSSASILNIRWDMDEYPQWVLFYGDILVLEWTNPDSGTMTWGVEVGLADATI